MANLTQGDIRIRIRTRIRIRILRRFAMTQGELKRVVLAWKAFEKEGRRREKGLALMGQAVRRMRRRELHGFYSLWKEGYLGGKK